MASHGEATSVIMTRCQQDIRSLEQSPPQTLASGHPRPEQRPPTSAPVRLRSNPTIMRHVIFLFCFVLKVGAVRQSLFLVEQLMFDDF